MTDKKTLAFYDQNAESYALESLKTDISDWYTDFEECLEPRARILDLGCGSGRDTKHFLEKGFDVVPVDGSPEMCRFAEYYLGTPVRCVRFSKLDYTKEFDGIWACASLLHVPQKDYRSVINKVERALKPYGVLYASFKYGEGERRDANGRYFSYYNENDLNDLSNLDLIEYWISEDVRPSHAGEQWLNTLWRKP